MKSERRLKILELISQHEIKTQDTLREMLSAAGYIVTQATMSRDINALGLVKTKTDEGRFCYVPRSALGVDYVGNEGSNTEFFCRIALFVAVAQNLVVVHCRPGMGGAALVAIGLMEQNSSVGMIAGGDTVFCAMQDNTAAAKLSEVLNELLRESLQEKGKGGLV